MELVLKAPGTKRSKPEYDTLLTNFAFKVNLRRYTEGYWIDPADGNNVLQCVPAEACYVFDSVEGVLSGNCTDGRGLTLLQFSA